MNQRCCYGLAELDSDMLSAQKMDGGWLYFQIGNRAYKSRSDQGWWHWGQVFAINTLIKKRDKFSKELCCCYQDVIGLYTFGMQAMGVNSESYFIHETANHTVVYAILKIYYI